MSARATLPVSAGVPSNMMNDPKRDVLVVEDDEDSATVLALLLGSRGHRVQTASNGYAALEICDAEPPQVVLCDLGLAGMSGYELAVELRQRRGSEQMLLVALTGWAGEDVAERCRVAGFDGHLVKPVQDFESLLTLVAKLEIPAASRLT